MLGMEPDTSHNQLEAQLSMLDLTFLSQCAQEELAQAESAALAEVADAFSAIDFLQAAASLPCGQFVEVLRSSGILVDLPSLQDSTEGACHHLPHLTVLAPCDAAMCKLSKSIRAEPEALYSWCGAHVCAGDASVGALHTLQGTIHVAATGSFSGSSDPAACSLPSHVGNSQVVNTVHFAHGVILLLDAVRHGTLRPRQRHGTQQRATRSRVTT